MIRLRELRQVGGRGKDNDRFEAFSMPMEFRMVIRATLSEAVWTTFPVRRSLRGIVAIARAAPVSGCRRPMDVG